jgi:hypothetical protein
MTMGWRSRSGAQEVIMIAQGEREREVIGVLTSDTTWRPSCEDDHTTVLNRVNQ